MIQIGLDIGFGTQVAAIRFENGDIRTGVTLSHYGRSDNGNDRYGFFAQPKGQIEVIHEGLAFFTGSSVGGSARTIRTDTNYTSLYAPGSGLVAACLGGLSNLLEPGVQYDAELSLGIPNGMLITDKQERSAHLRGLKKRWNGLIEWTANGKQYAVEATLKQIAPQALCAHSAWINSRDGACGDGEVVLSATIGANTIETALFVNNELAIEGARGTLRGGVVDLASSLMPETPYSVMDELFIRAGKTPSEALEAWSLGVAQTIKEAVPAAYSKLLSHVVISGGGTQIRPATKPRTTSGGMMVKLISSPGSGTVVELHSEPILGVALGALNLLGGE